MGFEHIIGNNKIKALLESSIINNNVLHSYMFIGQEGIGKYLFAKEFAKSILCVSDDSSSIPQKPCNSCKSCTEFDTENHPDFLTFQSEDGKNIKIEQIRYLQEKISEKPIVSSKKVYIINDSDLMTKEAQNCLLKTLEEPPLYAVIILVLSNENKLLNTIKSRCTKINFTPLTNEEIIQYFHTTYGESNFSQNILEVCNGSIGKALKLKDNVQIYQDIDLLIENIMHMDIVDIWNNSEVLYKSKDFIHDLLDYMNVIFMHSLKQNNNMKYANCIECIEKAKSRLLSNANYDMTIDYLLINLWEELNEKYSRC